MLLSDTHGRHAERTVPDGDVFVHAGDFSPWVGTLEETAEFNDFLGMLPHSHKVVIAGNHDGCFEHSNAEARMVLTNATYLQDEQVEIDGVKFYGSPWQPEFLDLAFNLPRGGALRDKWDLIPQDIDVLVTHGPPAGIGDRTFNGLRVGCKELFDRVREVKPKLHVFGHIHESRGTYEADGTIFVNASQRGDEHEAFVVDL